MLNIDKARKEKGVTLVDMADLLEVRYQTVSDKIQGKYPFTFEETIKLHKEFFSEYDLVYLFSEAVSTA
ncbi:TPA: helix-turn-helix transcriptional regulator [Streptococcus suis]|nr:helix-turn-helix transcriptional regulator [Streptococcus suis]